MTGVDANILVALAIGGHPMQGRSTELLRAEVAAGQRLVTTPAVLAEFLHAVTDPRRFSPPLDMSSAMDWTVSWLARPEAKMLTSGEAEFRVALRWMRKYQLGRKRILDTQFAATLHGAGVRRFVTSNPDDFRVFEVFDLITP